MTADDAISIVRAWEPPEEVILHRHIIESRELQPEDIGVLSRLLIRDPAQQATTIVALAKEFQDSGWKMGESRFTAIFKRLKKAGHIQHVPEFNPATGRPQWTFRVYRNPANNTQYVLEGSEAASQVRGGTVISTDPEVERVGEAVEATVSRGQSGSEVSTDPGANPWKSGIREATVSRGQSRDRGNSGSAVHPPHPPEEVTTSSPYPLVDASGLGPAAPGEEEGRVLDPEEIAAAARFLQLLPQPWSIGRLKAKALAVPLLEAMADQGWPQLAELTDRTRKLLVEQLTKNPVGVKNYGSLLERDRVPNLPLFETVADIPTQGSAPRPQQLPQEDPDFKPVPAPAKVADLLAALRKPSI